MSSLSELHLDALAEVFSIGAGRAALSLSEIVGDEVRISVPSVQIINSEDINSATLSLNNGRFGAVNQHFRGPFNAEAVLLFTEDQALKIVGDMMGSQMSIDELAEFEHEAMCELGNIILNACLSAMADIFSFTLESSLPDYAVASADEILHRLKENSTQPYIMVLHIDLTIEKRHTAGNLVFLLSSASLDNLVSHLDQFLGNIT
ncbi:chemotaxis protein CheC [Methylobacter sp. Wu8]|jgi:chemotaxis protein CheC|uniref:CheC inhibitor of MCP methylation n=1 Tax=Methylobacter tundripaludum TaxID=173365 RepID=A0A2S6H4U2_9GAMM|nr:chemotaxis protein CheC [Methylobacter tundripaludum]MCF7967422.1 chemotaxis protein CheC [Methylobacter tundripaludum]MCK9636457.1 chemotaxis protein CheC [Methylobacter tundripaludum]PPK72463.1 CheC inhibitor of MCP methylation [Methylobacter tundripaludum]